MSSYTGVRRAQRPEDYTDFEYRYPGCTISVQNQFYDQGLHVCQDHALDIWIKVQELVDPTVISKVAYEYLHPPEGDKPRVVRTYSDGEGAIYFLRIGEHIKIGFTTDLEQRMKAYPPDAEFLGDYCGTYADEQKIHQLLAASRAHRREWYRPTEQVMRMVDDIPNVQEQQRAENIRARQEAMKKPAEPITVHRSRPGAMNRGYANDRFHKLPRVVK